MTWIKNSKGVTLIELIVVLGLVSLVLLVGYNLLPLGLNTFGMQTENIDNQSRARQAIRQISGEIRKASSVDVIDEYSIDIDGVLYKFQEDENTLLRDGNDFMSGIKLFTTSRNGNEINLEITTLAKDSHEVTLSTLINIRE
jgi:prepilin-type N-terminal cleavage/methylation domain-containing protein